MKLPAVTLFHLMVLAIGLTIAAPFVASKNFGVHAQSNRISGYVYGLNRQPLDRLNVELRDTYHRSVGRTFTNGLGYYQFGGMGNGRYTIKVYTLGTDYEEQENSVEIANLLGGSSYEQSDFYLKLRRGVTPASAAVFVQEVPPEAKLLYEKAVDDLNNKRVADGITGLKSALAIFPKYFAALEILGIKYIEMNRPETFRAAEILLMVAVEVNARSYKGWYSLAYARHSLGKYPEAMSAVEKALELNKFSPDALILSGVLMRRAKNYAEAEKHLLKAKELSKDGMPRVYWELALLYGKDMKRYRDAARELKLFLKAQPATKDADKINALIAEYEAKSTTD